MEKKGKGKTEIKVADCIVLALSADANQKKKLNKRIRNDMDGNKSKDEKMRKQCQTENKVSSSSTDINKSQCMKEEAEQGRKKRRKHKRDIENDCPVEPPSNNLTPERNASAVTTDIQSGSSARSPNDILISEDTRQKVRKHKQRDSCVERNQETEKSEDTKSPTYSLSEKDILSQLPVNSCLKEDSEVNYDASSVCLSGDRIEAEKQCEKHDLGESNEVSQGVEVACGTSCLDAANIGSAAESDGKPVSEVNNIGISELQIHDDQAIVASSAESEVLCTYDRGEPIITYSRRRAIVSDPPAVNSKSIEDNRLLLLELNRMEKSSLVQSVETLPAACSLHVSEKEFDEADVKIPSLQELCASRDEIAQNNDMNLLPQEGSLTGSSQKKLLVLDINGLLADIVYHVQEGYTPDAVISGKSVFKRPFCDDFMEFCFARFNVGVWSSRTKRNVELILDFLLGSAKHKLLFCWDQSHCTDSCRTTVENRRKPLLVKKLKKLWRKYEPNLPWELGEYNESNTLLLDDSPYKAVCNPPYTAVFPPSYRYTDKEDTSLGPGGDLRVYLEGLAMADNVQKYVEENPLGARPITEKNPSWGFYLEVIRACSSPENSPISYPTIHWH